MGDLPEEALGLPCNTNNHSSTDLISRSNISPGMYVWCVLPGCKILWPVTIVKLGKSTVDVYCYADNEMFTVKVEAVQPFLSESAVAVMEKGLGLLKRKPSTKKAFLSDYEIAINGNKWPTESFFCDDDAAIGVTKDSTESILTCEDVAASNNENQRPTESFVCDDDAAIGVTKDSTESILTCKDVAASNNENQRPTESFVCDDVAAIGVTKDNTESILTCEDVAARNNENQRPTESFVCDDVAAIGVTKDNTESILTCEDVAAIGVTKDNTESILTCDDVAAIGVTKDNTESILTCEDVAASNNENQRPTESFVCDDVAAIGVTKDNTESILTCEDVAASNNENQRPTESFVCDDVAAIGVTKDNTESILTCEGVAASNNENQRPTESFVCDDVAAIGVTKDNTESILTCEDVAASNNENQRPTESFVCDDDDDDDYVSYSELEDSDADIDYVPPTEDEDEDNFIDTLSVPSMNVHLKKSIERTVPSNFTPKETIPVSYNKNSTDIRSNTSQGAISASLEMETNSEFALDDSSYKRKIRHMYRNITVAGYERKNNKRNYSKLDFCYFCKNSYSSKISKHILGMHFDEPAVKEIISEDIGSNKRKLLLLKVQNEGNYIHNVKVLQDGCGELVVKRRPDQKNSSFAEDYVPCEYCLAFVKDNTLWLHAKNCPFNSTAVEKNYLRNGRTMLQTFLKNPNENSELSELFDQMKETQKNPGLQQICENDVLIREFATCLLEKLGTNEERRRKDKDNIRTKVRTVARCLKQLNQSKFRDLSLSDYICGKDFNSVVSVVKDLSVECDSPNLALTLGHYLKQICLLKKSLAIQNSDERMKQDANDFRELYDAHWNSKVSAVSHRRLRLRQINKKIDIPSTDDLVTLKEFLCSELKKQRNMKPSNDEWVRFAEILMARIVLFNKRRISEVEELKILDFRNRLSGENIGEEIHLLETSERVLASRMDLIEVRGKSTRGLRKVFILLEPDMVKGIEYLLMTRIHVGINPQNKYVFGRSSLNPLDGCSAIRNAVALCSGLKNPNSIRSTLLRRYLATASQLLDMTGDELKMVADHMGHSVAIHTDIYRMQTSTIERTKVARALIALENGKLDKFKGRNLNSVQIEEIPLPVGRNEIELEDTNDSVDESNFNEDLGEVGLDDIIGNDIEDMEIDEETDVTSSSAEVKSKKIQRKPWTDEQNDILKKHFSSYLTRKNIAVRNEEIRQVLAQFKCMKGRTLPQIRAKLNNMKHGKCK